MFDELVDAVQQADPRQHKQLYLTGHSLGGALAAVFAACVAHRCAQQDYLGHAGSVNRRSAIKQLFWTDRCHAGALASVAGSKRSACVTEDVVRTLCTLSCLQRPKLADNPYKLVDGIMQASSWQHKQRS